MASTRQARGTQSAAADAPFGVSDRHLHPPSRTLTQAVLIAVLLVPLGAAMLGYLGGGDSERSTVRSSAATLSIERPRIARSGNWFETRIIAVPSRDVADLTVAIDKPLWHRMSIDTLAPDADSSEFAEGAFRYAFGPVGAGEPFELKLNGQLQSWGYRRLEGDVTLLDGQRELARVPLTLTVLP